MPASPGVPLDLPIPTKIPENKPIFLDTSIQIARKVHSKQTKQSIRTTLEKCSDTATGLVSRQEFKRRLLTEAQYLLTLLHRRKNFNEVYHHLIRLPAVSRKKDICLQIISEIYGKDDAEAAERLKYLLRSLLTVGMADFDRSVTNIEKGSNCRCAIHEVKEIKALEKYDLGPDKCEDTKRKDGSTKCGIVTFLKNKREPLENILNYLQTVPAENRSDEINKIIEFIEVVINDPEQAIRRNPCLKVGDLLIALESSDHSTFFTMNWKESQHLCRVLNQTLILLPADPQKQVNVFEKENNDWTQIRDQKTGGKGA